NRYLAYSYDTSGDERYRAAVIDLVTGEALPDVLENMHRSIMFNADATKLMYSLLEDGKWLAKNINVHTLGTSQAEDQSIYYEADDGFALGFGKTSSKEWVVIQSTRGETHESHILPADFSGKPQQITSREDEFRQSIDHAHGDFYILANDTHANFRLARVSDKAPQHENWQTVIPGSDESYLLSLQTFKGFIALGSRDLGLEKMIIRDYDGNSEEIQFPEDLFTTGISINPEFDQTHLRLGYESMITPNTVYDYDITEKSLTTRKVQNIPSGYDKSQYEAKRIMAPARDGTLVPVSLVYKKGFKQDGSHPMWLYGYGAYSITIEPDFSTMRLSALDRGFVYAVAHVRGGAMMGYNWYLDGKLKKRTNTFNDFVDVANYLVEQKYVAAGNISISGRSAGGELMGAAVIQAPDLWRSVNLGVPFVDVLNTMLDASLPLTPPEWKEWGNPIESAEDYALIKSYSPYDNIIAREYPPMFVSGGINDPRVTYWEPAKWTAKMRDKKTDDNLLIQRINMGAGHFSNSGRYGRLKDFAEEFAFMFLAHEISE
ncbi:MAG: prolyl oligopeptidase family serine peptidase, partial [Pseudomonadota bacterium]